MSYVNTCHELDELGGGHNRSIIHIKPVAYRNNGSLTAIVSDWLDAGIPGRPHMVTAAPFIVSCGDGGTRRIHPTRDLERYLEIGRPYNVVTRQPYPLNAFTRTGNHLVSENSGADLHMWHGGHFLKFGLELKGGWLPTNEQFAFPVDMVGLTRSGGNILADGVPVMHIRPPVAYDWANPDDVRPIGWEFASLSGQVYAVFTLPSLTGMARPVVDPTLDLQPDAAAGKDTKISGGVSTQSYGLTPSITAGTVEKGLLEFDVSSIAASSTCDSATFSVFQYGSGTALAFTLTHYAIAIGNAAWIEGGSNSPAAAGDPCWNALAADGSGGVTTAWAGSAGLATSGTDYEASSIGSVAGNRSDANGTEYAASLTASRVAGWFSASNTNYGILTVTNANHGNLASSDHGTAAYRPRLVVVWTAAGGGAGNPWWYYAQQ